MDRNEISISDENMRVGILPGKTPVYFTYSLGSELSIFVINNLEKINNFLDNFSAPL